VNAVPKLNLVRDRKYLDWLHNQPCVISGLYGNDQETIDPAHLGSKRNHGDDEVLPVLHRYHLNGHNTGEPSNWRELIPDWLLMEALRAYAREMYRGWKRP